MINQCFTTSLTMTFGDPLGSGMTLILNKIGYLDHLRLCLLLYVTVNKVSVMHVTALRHRGTLQLSLSKGYQCFTSISCFQNGLHCCSSYMCTIHYKVSIFFMTIDYSCHLCIKFNVTSFIKLISKRIRFILTTFHLSTYSAFSH